MITENLTSVYPGLQPIVSDWINDLVRQPEFLSQQLEKFGSPVNIHNPKLFINNFKTYTAQLSKYRLKHLIYFARKANKCRVFVKEAQKLDFGIDTASYRELQQCLELNYNPAKLVLTAAVKREQLLLLAAKKNVLIILDNFDECRQLNNIARNLGKLVDVGIRLSGFTFQNKKLYSRFGFDIDNALELLTEKFHSLNNLKFRGFQFHLNGYSTQQRGSAIIQIINLIDALQNKDVATEFLDIGGGLLMNYLQSKREWINFHDELKLAVAGKRSPITFENHGLGLTCVHGDVIGRPAVYPYYNQCSKEKFLEEVLNYRNNKGETVAKLIRDRQLEFRMEPGRSLLDQSGLTVARVAYRKWDNRNQLLVGLEMNGTQLSSSSADFLMDPIIVFRNVKAKPSPSAGYLMGARCLEQDVILKRKIIFQNTPEIGDMVCFPNTAGYLMHFYETEAHQFKLAQNLVLTVNSRQQYDCIRDEE